MLECSTAANTSRQKKSILNDFSTLVKRNTIYFHQLHLVASAFDTEGDLKEGERRKDRSVARCVDKLYEDDEGQKRQLAERSTRNTLPGGQ